MQNLDDVLQPIAKAKGLPNSHYLDEATHREECDKLFFANWTAIAFKKDLPQPGYALPVDFLSQPLLIIRDRDDAIRVFQNTCRHRGMILVENSGPLKGAIRCPYHSWCYSPAGKLITTPHVAGPGNNSDPNINRENLGLIEFSTHVWKDIIFVNLNANAEPFPQYANDLIERWQEFEQPIYHSGEDSSFKLTVNCNWKLAVENYCESYHLPWIHPGLNAYSRLEDHYHIVKPGKFSGQGTTVYAPRLDDTGRAFENFAAISEKWEKSAEYIALYPNLLLGIHRDHFYAILLQPVDQHTTIEHVEIYYARESAMADNLADLRARNTAQWKAIFDEDIFVVEGMQRGRNAMRFDGGKFAPVMDEPTHAFHHWVASQMAL